MQTKNVDEVEKEEDLESSLIEADGIVGLEVSQMVNHSSLI